MDIDNKWLGWEGLNLRMAGSKPAALPLGYTPINCLVTQCSITESTQNLPNNNLKTLLENLNNASKNNTCKFFIKLLTC